VTFAFDHNDRLVGVVEQPAATLDHEEVRVYIETLARECDRFEYTLTGKTEVSFSNKDYECYDRAEFTRTKAGH